MKFPAHKTVVLAVVILGLAFAGSGMASAQDVFKVNYFSNNTVAGAPDATVRIDNPGYVYGNLCAMIYVFAADQQMAECCGCIQSHDNLNTYSVARNLASPARTLTGQFTPSGVIKIVSALPNSGTGCNPAITYKPTVTLRAWATHIQNKVGTSFPITESAFEDAPLGTTELANLQAECSFIDILGSGYGICSCGAVE